MTDGLRTRLLTASLERQHTELLRLAGEVGTSMRGVGGAPDWRGIARDEFDARLHRVRNRVSGATDELRAAAVLTQAAIGELAGA
jgi:hypothetical protein